MLFSFNYSYFNFLYFNDCYLSTAYTFNVHILYINYHFCLYAWRGNTTLFLCPTCKFASLCLQASAFPIVSLECTVSYTNTNKYLLTHKLYHRAYSAIFCNYEWLLSIILLPSAISIFKHCCSQGAASFSFLGSELHQNLHHHRTLVYKIKWWHHQFSMGENSFHVSGKASSAVYNMNCNVLWPIYVYR
jgi:hypothetical protein